MKKTSSAILKVPKTIRIMMSNEPSFMPEVLEISRSQSNPRLFNTQHFSIFTKKESPPFTIYKSPMIDTKQINSDHILPIPNASDSSYIGGGYSHFTDTNSRNLAKTASRSSKYSQF